MIILFKLKFNLLLSRASIWWKDATSLMYYFLDFLYFDYKILLLRFFKKPMPFVNKWGSADLDMCVKPTVVTDHSIQIALTRYSMIAPRQLIEYIKTSLKEKTGVTNDS